MDVEARDEFLRALAAAHPPAPMGDGDGHHHHLPNDDGGGGGGGGSAPGTPSRLRAQKSDAKLCV